MSFTCIFVYVQQTLIGILNGFNKQKEALVSSLCGDAIRIGFVWFVVPVYGISGYVAGMITSSVVVCLLNLRMIMKTTGMSLPLRKWIIKPGLVFGAMALLAEPIRRVALLLPVGGRLQTVAMVGIQVLVGLLAISCMKKSK